MKRNNYYSLKNKLFSGVSKSVENTHSIWQTKNLTVAMKMCRSCLYLKAIKNSTHKLVKQVDKVFHFLDIFHVFLMKNL